MHVAPDLGCSCPLCRLRSIDCGGQTTDTHDIHPTLAARQELSSIVHFSIQSVYTQNPSPTLWWAPTCGRCNSSSGSSCVFDCWISVGGMNSNLLWGRGGWVPSQIADRRGVKGSDSAMRCAGKRGKSKFWWFCALNNRALFGVKKWMRFQWDVHSMAMRT